ncbi:MAG: helix-turn-helix domain-containing protein [Rhodobacteraceae bacterium]|nr:helix-turn-helix domain-containing protein [Paracoccaceae bacterium]
MQASALEALARRLAIAPDPTVRAGLALEGVLTLLPQWRNAGLLAVDADRATVTLLDHRGPVSPRFAALRTRWPLAVSPARLAFETGQTVLVGDATTDPRFPLLRADAQVEGYCSVAMAPVCRNASGGLVISCHAPQRLAATEAATAWLGALAALLGLALGGRLPSVGSAALAPGRALYQLRAAGEPWLETAEAFVRHEGRMRPTAAALGIHVTTLAYRLDRIHDRFALDLRDREARAVLRRLLESASET